MKIKTLLSAILALCVSGLLFAQTTTIGIGTGAGTPGQQVTGWTVKVPGSSSYSNTYYCHPVPGYDTDVCGAWITPALDPTNSPDVQASGMYKYRLTFPYSKTCAISAIFDMSFLAGDNWVRNIYVNNHAVTVPTSPYIDFHPGKSVYQNISSFIVSGLNVIEIWVENEPSPFPPMAYPTKTGMMACGTLTITEDCGCFNTKPKGLNCYSEGADHYLNWFSVNGASAYQMEINYNDPDCCEGGGGVITYRTTLPQHPISNYYTFQPTACYSWRVRTLCDDNPPITGANYGPWSDKQCGCGAGEEPGDKLFRSQFTPIEDEAKFELTGVVVAPNPSDGRFRIETPQAERFSYSVMSISGVVLEKPQLSSGQSEELDLSHLSKGMYFIKITAGSDQKVIPIQIR